MESESVPARRRPPRQVKEEKTLMEQVRPAVQAVFDHIVMDHSVPDYIMLTVFR